MSSFYSGSRGTESAIPWPSDAAGQAWAWRPDHNWSQGWSSSTSASVAAEGPRNEAIRAENLSAGSPTEWTSSWSSSGSRWDGNGAASGGGRSDGYGGVNGTPSAASGSWGGGAQSWYTRQPSAVATPSPSPSVNGTSTSYGSVPATNGTSTSNGSVPATNGTATTNGYGTTGNTRATSSYFDGGGGWASGADSSRTWSSETVAAAAPLPVPVFRAAAVVQEYIPQKRAVSPPRAARKAAVAPATPPKPPEAAEVQKALADLREQAEPAEGGEKALRFATAVQLCAASGDGAKALDLLDQMKDALEPDLATYLAGLSACEVSRQPLERVWFLLDDMRKQGLDLDAPLDLGDGDQALLQGPAGLVYHEANLGVWEALQHHARTWLVTAPPQKALHAAARLGGLLRSHGSEDEVTLGAALREYLVKPVVQALQHGLEPQSPLAVVLHAAPNLGAFTVEVLVALGLATSDSGASPWQLAAAEELRRQAMLRQWANWHEPGGPGLLAWMAYDLNGGDSKASWEMCSDGECYGRAPIDSKSESDELLPPLARDASSTGHAERRALLALTEQILLRFPADSSECLRVEGVILIYTPQSPATASIYAMRQFLQLFPWVVLRVAFGPESGRAVWELPERRVEVIGESRPPNTLPSGRPGDGWTSNYPLHSLKGGGKADGKGKGKDGKGKPVATNGTNGSNGRG